MFNGEIKNRFLEELPTESSKTVYACLFRRTADYEKQLNKDIFEFNLQDCLGLISSLSPKSINGVGVFKSQFNKYVEWVLDNDTAGAKNNYWKLVPIDDDYAKISFKFRYVKDINELTDIVNIGLASKYDKYIIYLLYMGIMGEKCEEISLLTDGDIRKNQGGMIITKRRVYTNIISPLSELIKSDKYVEERKKRDMDSTYFVKPFLTKKLEGQPVGEQHIYQVFRKLNDNYFEAAKEKKIYSPVTIWRSGLFYSLYNSEKSKSSDLLPLDYREMFEVYGKSKKEIGAFPREYKLYKDVFWSD